MRLDDVAVWAHPPAVAGREMTLLFEFSCFTGVPPSDRAFTVACDPRIGFDRAHLLHRHCHCTALQAGDNKSAHVPVPADLHLHSAGRDSDARWHSSPSPCVVLSFAFSGRAIPGGTRVRLVVAGLRAPLPPFPASRSLPLAVSLSVSSSAPPLAQTDTAFSTAAFSIATRTPGGVVLDVASLVSPLRVLTKGIDTAIDNGAAAAQVRDDSEALSEAPVRPSGNSHSHSPSPSPSQLTRYSSAPNAMATAPAAQESDTLVLKYTGTDSEHLKLARKHQRRRGTKPSPKPKRAGQHKARVRARAVGTRTGAGPRARARVSASASASASAGTLAALVGAAGEPRQLDPRTAALFAPDRCRPEVAMLRPKPVSRPVMGAEKSVGVAADTLEDRLSRAFTAGVQTAVEQAQMCRAKAERQVSRAMLRASKVSKVSDASAQATHKAGATGGGSGGGNVREAADCAISLKSALDIHQLQHAAGNRSQGRGTAKEQGRGHPGAYIPAWQQQATRTAQRKLQGLLAQLDEAEHDRRREAAAKATLRAQQLMHH